MSVKEFIVSRVRLFFILTVMIMFAQWITGMILDPEATLHYRDLSSPFKMAGLCILPTVVTYSRKKLTLREMLIRHAIQLLLIEGVMMLLVFTGDFVKGDRLPIALLIAGITLVIYCFAVLLMWLNQLSESKKMTAQLHQLQQSAAEESQD
jgi:hypothetical protein